MGKHVKQPRHKKTRDYGYPVGEAPDFVVDVITIGIGLGIWVALLRAYNLPWF